MKEKEIAELVFESVTKNEELVIKEKVAPWGEAGRADIVILNKRLETITGIEIKSEYDTFGKRALEQEDYYHRIFDSVVFLVTPKHLYKATNSLKKETKIFLLNSKLKAYYPWGLPSDMIPQQTLSNYGIAQWLPSSEIPSKYKKNPNAGKIMETFRDENKIYPDITIKEPYNVTKIKALQNWAKAEKHKVLRKKAINYLWNKYLPMWRIEMERHN